MRLFVSKLFAIASDIMLLISCWVESKYSLNRNIKYHLLDDIFYNLHAYFENIRLGRCRDAKGWFRTELVVSGLGECFEVFFTFFMLNIDRETLYSESFR